MATTFKNFAADTTTTPSVIYTAPAGKSSVVTFLNVANNSTTLNGVCNVWLRDTSTGVDSYLGRNIVIPMATAVNFVAEGAKLVLEAGDSIVVSSTAANTLTFVGSSAEMG